MCVCVCKPTQIYKGLGALIYRGCICVLKGEGGGEGKCPLAVPKVTFLMSHRYLVKGPVIPKVHCHECEPEKTHASHGRHLCSTSAPYGQKIYSAKRSTNT